MKYVIARTNGTVVQYWDDNKAAWGFLMSGINSDVSWNNFGNKTGGRIETPKYFYSFGQAMWYMRKRKSHLHKGDAERDKKFQYMVVTLISEEDLQ